MKKIGWIILGVVVALALLLGGIWWGSTGASPYGPWGMMGRYGYPMMGGWWGGLGMLLFWALVIGGIVWLVLAVSRSQSPTGTPRPAGETPLDVLKRRYAAGEISKEQFDEMKHNLDV